jgi:tetratricopeptide (TPR) repeat protein
MVAIWISLALEKVLEKTRSEKLWKIPGYLALFAVAFLPLMSNLEENDRSDDYIAYDYNKAILESLEKDAIYIPGGDYSSFPAIYLQAVEGIRRDVILGNITGYLSPDYMKYAASIPGYDGKLSGKELETFVIRNSDRPVYYNQKSDIPGRGKLVVVPQGLVFRVLPETTSPEVAPKWNCDNALRMASRFKASNEVVVSILTDFHVKKGEYYFSIGDEAKGAEEWEKASEISRHTKEILNNVGCGYAEHGLYEQAEEKFKESIRIYPGYRLGFKNLAKLFEDTGRLKEAVSVYETLIELEPEAKEYSDKVNQLASGLQTDRIAEQLELVSKNPDEPSAWNNLGNMYAEQREYVKAIAAYEKALELNPDYALPHRNLSLVYENLGEAEKASYHRQRYEILK